MPHGASDDIPALNPSSRPSGFDPNTALSKNASYHLRLQPSIGNDVSEAELKDTMISETIGRNRKT